MSEQAKVAYLQERMKETKRRERIALVASMFGVVLAVTGFMLSEPRFLGTTGIWLGVLGVILAVMEGISYVVNSYHYLKFMEELKTMAGQANPTCPKCGKEIPRGKFAFCPFCGSPLTPPPP